MSTTYEPGSGNDPSGGSGQDYGQRVYPQQGHDEPLSIPLNGGGTAALVLGIVAVFTGFFLIGGVFGIVAVILGFLGLDKVKRAEANNRGVAIAGIVTGIIGILTAVAVFLTVFLYMIY